MNKLPIYFAPLQGYTEDAYRRAHNDIVGRIERYLTPFVRTIHGEVRSNRTQGMEEDTQSWKLEKIRGSN